MFGNTKVIAEAIAKGPWHTAHAEAGMAVATFDTRTPGPECLGRPPGVP
jgi:hypothetical protein